mmetsp:Transcript_40246/g.46054  ORF Transcript_40246/g.46054 Transcript_40246/m.46054 type:complete len:519 (+) Transcript_40246:56-1612(+)
MDLSFSSIPWTTIICLLVALVVYRLFLKPWVLVFTYYRQGVPYFKRNPYKLNPSWMIHWQDYIAPVYPKYFTSVVGPFSFLYLTDPALCKEVLQTKESSFVKSEFLIPLLREFLGNGLLFSNGEIWKSERRVINKAFRHENLLKMSQLIEVACNSRIQKWKDMLNETEDHQMEVDWKAEMQELTVDVIGQCAFGGNYSSVEFEGNSVKITDLTQELEEEVMRYSQNFSYWICPKKMELDLDQGTCDLRQKAKALRYVGKKIIRDRIDLLRKKVRSLEDSPDLLDLMLAVHLEDKDLAEAEKLVDLDLLVDECATFILAGSETTSTLLTWTFYNLTKHPEVLRKLRAELLEELGENLKEDPKHLIKDFPALDKLPYLSRVMLETLRLYPSAPLLSMKEAIEDVQLKGLSVKKGTNIMISPFIIHRSPFYWKDPKVFNPDRPGLDETDGRFLAFSTGKRSCIGQFFARMEAKIAIAKFAFAMDIKCDIETPINLEYKITLYMKQPLPARLSQWNPPSNLS